MDTGFRLFTDNGFSLEEIAFGDPCELAASKTFVSRLLYSCLEKKLYKMNGLLEVSQFMPQNEFELFHAKYWERRVSFVGLIVGVSTNGFAIGSLFVGVSRIFVIHC